MRTGEKVHVAARRIRFFMFNVLVLGVLQVIGTPAAVAEYPE